MSLPLFCDVSGSISRFDILQNQLSTGQVMFSQWQTKRQTKNQWDFRNTWSILFNSCQICSISKVYHSTPFWRPSDLGPIQTGLCCQRSMCKVTSVSYQTQHLTVFLLEQQQFDKVFPLYWTRSLWSSWPFTSEIRDVVVLLQHGQRGGVQV